MVSTAKNTFYLLIAYIYQKLIALFYFIVLARYLGADGFGKYTFALSFTALFSVIIDFGMYSVLTREIARDKEKTKKYFGNILTFSLVSGIFVLILVCFLINVLHYPLVTKRLVYFSGLIIFLDTLALSFYFVFRGHLNTKYEALGVIIHKTVMFLAGLFLIFIKAKLFLMLLPLLLASCFYLTNAVFWLKRKLNIWPVPRFDKETLKSLLKLSWPFFIAALFAKLYATSDTILLSYLADDQAVGWYNAAQKLTNAFMLLIAGSLSSALYPSLSYYFVRSKEEMGRVFTQAIFYLMLITIPLVFGLLILAKPIILFIYGTGYTPAVTTLILLAYSIPFMFLDFIMVSLLNAGEKQKINTLIHGLGAGLFLILNLILIPLFSQNGAALAVFLGMAIIFILEVYCSKKIVRIEKKYLFKKIIYIFFSSVLMGIPLFLLRDRIHLVFSVIFGILVYFVFAFAFHLIQKKEMVFLKEFLLFKKGTENGTENVKKSLGT